MVRCTQCQQELKLITGHATIRLYRCEGCGAQQLLPGDPTAPAGVSGEPAQQLDDPIAAAAALIAQHPGSRPKIPRAAVFALAAIALAVLMKAVFF